MRDVVVLKCGGSTIDALSEQFFNNIKTLQQAGLKPVLVHGGGPAIQHMLDTLNIPFEFVDGLRKTTEEMMDVVEMVLSGQMNNALTRKVNKAGMQALGLSGSDVKLLTAKPKDFKRFGYVGEISQVNKTFLQKLLSDQVIPVISPIAIGLDGKRYNVNADTAAGAIAKALHAKQLIFVTDVPGVMKDGELLETVTAEDIKKLIADGVIYGGMIPKVKAALNSLDGNVHEVMIVDGKNSVLESNSKLVGTVIKKAVEAVK